MSPVVPALICGVILGGLAWMAYEELRWELDTRRARRLLAESEARDMALYRSEAAKWGEMASTLSEIRGLPEVVPWGRWLP